MSFVDARVRVQHPCPFCEFSDEFPDVAMTQWCNRSSEVLQVSVPDPGRLDEVLRSARARFEVRELFTDGASALTISRRCSCTGASSVSGLAESQGMWLIPPILYREGWETHRLVAPDAEALRRFVDAVRRIGSIEVLSIRPRDRLDAIRDLGVVPVHLFEDLTDRQIRVLVAAFEGGLFESPAHARMGPIARRVGVARSTFGEHLRKAQLRILRNAYPYLKLRADGGTLARPRP
jgi:hypothetical protein